MALPDAASTGRVSLRVGAAQDRDRPAATVVCALALQAEDDPALPAEDDPALQAEDDPALQAEDDPALPAEDDPALPAEDDPALPAEDDPALPAEDDPAVPAEDDPALPAEDDQGCRDADHRIGGGAGDGSEAICCQSTWRVTHALMHLRPRGL